MALDELAPRGNDPPGVRADLDHVGELDALRAGAELRSKRVDLGRVQHHERRLVGLEPFLHEGPDPLRELVLSAVEERLVTERF